MDEIMRALAASDPAAHAGLAELDARARCDLRLIVDGTSATMSTPKRLPSRRALLVPLTGVVVVAAVAAALLGVPRLAPTATAAAATPAPVDLTGTRSARAKLITLAAALASRDNGPSRRTLQVIRYQQWALATRIDGRQVNSAVVPIEVTFTRRGDGSARRHAATGRPQFSSSTQRERWVRNGMPGNDRTVVENRSWAAGGFESYYPERLPTRVAPLLRTLSVGHPIKQNGPAEPLVAIADLYREQQPSAHERAALIRVLTRRGAGVKCVGPVTDRSGRSGYAVYVTSSSSGLPTRYVAVLDPRSGRLLDYEEVLTSSPGKLGVRIPAVISYTSME